MSPADDSLQAELRDILERLRTSKEMQWHSEVVTRWSGSADRGIGGLLTLHEALSEVESEAFWALFSFTWEIEQHLACLHDGRGVPALLRLTSRPIPGLRSPILELRRRQKLAGLLALRQSPRLLMAWLLRLTVTPGSLELPACWMYEYVTRGLDLEQEDGARRWRKALVEAGHPLGVLPLRLLDVEAGLPACYGAPQGHPMADERGALPAEAGRRSVPHELRDEALRERLTTVVREWSSGNQRIEARAFTLTPPVLARTPGPELLGALRLDCLEGAGEDTLRALSSLRPEAVFRSLFSAAAAGGPYTEGQQGAYGRLDAWRSLAALAGAEEGLPLEEVEGLTLACGWVDLVPPRVATPWFLDSRWQLAVAALHADGASLAVLAATEARDEDEK
ncbi:DUF6183 family protein [Pyxidicoccus xibeiensis]|uniref:DUF6183 family protein n=1 Tax=Pyxidicoccus xibeiensis TaxID=2906759 RepID=UPI0020A7A99F|nr:DUF6183 family protein [Pyxidicoccus xibeiensis]MCP3137089.1 DUF6183 family protein [Pyxidicoccus xibeiensis]